MDQRQLVTAIYEKVSGLSDLDWSELAVQSGTGLHPDHLRKMGAGIRLAMEAGMFFTDSTMPNR